MTKDVIQGDDLQAEMDALRIAASNAISAWQLVEEELFQIYFYAVLPNNRKIAAVTFHAMIHFDAKLRVTTEVLKHLLKGNPLLEEWIKDTGNGGLNQKLKKKASKRNSYAHGAVTYVATGKDQGSKICPPTSWLMVDLDEFNSRSVSLGMAKDDFKSFTKLFSDLRAFRKKLRKHLASP